MFLALRAKNCPERGLIFAIKSLYYEVANFLAQQLVNSRAHFVHQFVDHGIDLVVAWPTRAGLPGSGFFKEVLLGLIKLLAQEFLAIHLVVHHIAENWYLEIVHIFCGEAVGQF